MVGHLSSICRPWARFLLLFPAINAMLTPLPTLVVEFTRETRESVRMHFWTDEKLNGSQRSVPLAGITHFLRESNPYYDGLNTEELSKLGKTLFQWLDGDDRLLTTMLEAMPTRPAEVLLAIVAGDTEVHRLPWELLHDGVEWCHARGSLALIPVRCTRAPQKTTMQAPVNRPLGVLFMAASPQIAGRPPLDFEIEEGRILQGNESGKSVQVLVEESGNLNELQQLWQSLDSEDPLDVLHLSGHAGHSDEPVFEFETLEGELDLVTARRLNEAFPRRPRLAFLCGCSTGMAHGADNSQSFAQRLVHEGWPAVLGWGNSIADSHATLAATTLYGQLELGKSLGSALRHTWRTLCEEKKGKSWHLLRLHCFQLIPAAVVTAQGTKGREPPMKLAESEFLDPEKKQSKVADRLKFVGRRRLLQSAIRLLINPPAGQVGLILHGQGGRGKSSTAARLCDRLRTRFSRVVIFGKLDELALINAICAIFPKGLRFASARQELEKTLRDSQIPLKNRLEIAMSEASQFELFNLLFVLDDFEQNQPRASEGDRSLDPPAASLLKLLCETCEQLSLGRLLITGRYDLPESFHCWLHSEQVLPLTAQEQRKQLMRLAPTKLDKNAEKLLPVVSQVADGNPRLYEWLYDVLACSGLDHADLLGRLRQTEQKFQETILLQYLVQSLPAGGAEILSRLLVFEEPIPESLACELCADTVVESMPPDNVKLFLRRCIALGLVDRYREQGANSVRAVRQLTRGEPPFIALASAETAKPLVRQGLPQLEEFWWKNGDCPESTMRELIRLAGLVDDSPRLVRFTRKLASLMMDNHRATECLELLHPLLDAAGRDPLLLVHGARAAAQLGAGAQCDQWMREAAGAIEQLPADERVTVMFYESERLVRGGDSNLALKMLREQLVPLLNSLGDVRSKAVTMGKIADIMQARGELDEALRIRREESLPVYERLGDVREKVIGSVKLALNLLARGNIEDLPEIIDLFRKSLADAERCRLAEAEQIRNLFNQLLGKK